MGERERGTWTGRAAYRQVSKEVVSDVVGT